MAIDLEKLGLTRRAQVMLGVLAVMAAGYFLAGTDDPPQPVPVQVGTAAKSAAPEAKAPPATAQAAAVPPTPVLRDPFYVPPSFQRQGDVDRQGTANIAGPRHEAAAVPQLQGTVRGETGAAVILSLGPESRALKAGDTFGGYTVVAIGTDYAELAGPGGSVILRVGR